MAFPETAAGLAEELLYRERALAERDAAALDGGFEALIAGEFVEFGVSGRVWDRASTIAALREAVRRAVAIDDFRVRRFGPDVALATYGFAVQGDEGETHRSLRASLRVRNDGAWQLAFHQGTALEGAGGTARGGQPGPVKRRAP